MGFTVDDITFQYADIKARTPARCRRDTGEIFININRWKHIKPEHRVYILLHEMGHIILNSSDELAVDAWAQKEYLAAGYPLSDSVKALTQVFVKDTPITIARANRALEYAKKIDANFNQPFKKKDNTMCENCIDNNKPWFHRLQPTVPTEVGYDDFLGIGGTKTERKEKRQIRRDGKKSRSEAKNYAIRAKADAKLSLANQGISEKALGKKNTSNLLGGVLGAATSITGSILGGGSATGEAGSAVANALTIKDELGNDIPNPDYAPEGSQGNNSKAKEAWYKSKNGKIGIGVAVAAIIGIAIYFIRKNK